MAKESTKLEAVLASSLVRSKVLGLCPELSPRWCLYSLAFTSTQVTSALFNFFRFKLGCVPRSAAAVMLAGLTYFSSIILMSLAAKFRKRRNFKLALSKLETVDDIVSNLGHNFIYDTSKVGTIILAPVLPVLVGYAINSVRLTSSVENLMRELMVFMVWLSTHEILVQFATMTNFFEIHFRRLGRILRERNDLGVLHSAVDSLLLAHTLLITGCAELNRVFSSIAQF